MSVNAIRALILLANLALFGLVGWLCYDTFVAVDRDRYHVEPPKLERYKVPEIAQDESQTKKELYKAIPRVLDRPPPPPTTPPPPPKPEEAPRADPTKIEVLSMILPNVERGVLGSAYLTAPLANPKDPIFFQEGLDLGVRTEFGAYKGCVVKEVRADGVIITDPKGREVRLAPPPTVAKEPPK